jgi:hypothetical protein
LIINLVAVPDINIGLTVLFLPNPPTRQVVTITSDNFAVILRLLESLKTDPLSLVGITTILRGQLFKTSNAPLIPLQG